MLSRKPPRVKEAYKARTLHYLTYLLPPLEIHEHQIMADTILGVLEFPPRKDRPFCSYVTSGMSDLWQSSPSKETMFTELLFYAKKAEQWLEDFLVKLAAYPFEEHTFFAPGQTLPLAGPIVPKSQLTSLVLLEPLLEHNGFKVITEVPGKRIEIIWALPITESERQLIISQGQKPFLNWISLNNLPLLLDFHRPSFV